MSSSNVALVIPTIRNLDFLSSWSHEFNDPNIRIYVCEDHDTREIGIPNWSNIEIFSRNEITMHLQKKAWVIPHFNASIRSFGYWKAYKDGADYILTIDDDCLPGSDKFVATHIKNLSYKADPGWVSSCNFRTRGYPYDIRATSPVHVSHGLWENVADHDAPTQLALNTDLPTVNRQEVVTRIIPTGSYFPMCGMNLAFTRDIAPAMYFLLQGKFYEFDRFDDIWAGLFVKRVCDKMGWSIITGFPTVYHSRASNVYSNLIKEAKGIGVHEKFWRHVDQIPLTKTTVKELYIELADGVRQFEYSSNYFAVLSDAMKEWVGLFD